MGGGRWRAGLAVALGVAGLLPQVAEAQDVLSVPDLLGVFASRDAPRYSAGEASYLHWVGRVGSGEVPPRLVAQLALVVPDSLADALAARPAPPDLGARLVRWWRASDPLPATPANERVLEHLLRVTAALDAFAADTPTGFDARGDVFVRFGRPAKKRVVDVEADLFIARAIREEPTVRRTDFPRNEVWYYPALGADTYFVFVERRGVYEPGEPLDLLPPALQAGGLSGALESRARLLGQTLRWVHKDLAEFSSRVRSRLLTLDGAVGADGSAYSGTTGLVLQRELQRARREDAEDRETRDATLPAGATQIRRAPFGVARRAAVFLDDAASPTPYSVWVGWGQERGRLALAADSLADLGLEPDRFAVVVTAVGYDAAYERSGTDARVSLLGPADAPTVGWDVVEGVAPGGSVAVEWDLHPSNDAAELLLPGAVAADVVRVGPVGIDWEGGVALSGMLPIDAREALAMDEVDRWAAFPKPRLRPAVRDGEPIGVYYEIYAREPGTEVDLEVRAVRIREGRIFRPGTDFATGTSSRVVLDETRSSQIAVVDVGDLDRVDQLRLEVTVTEVATSARATRSLTFDLD